MTAIPNRPEQWLKLFPFPQPEGNKYTRGHALIYGGPVMTGAARLAARAAQRIGAGLVTIAAPASAAPLYAAALESVIVRPLERPEDWPVQLADPKKNVILIGPGMGPDANSKGLVLAALATRKPCVLDADALSCFADAPETLFAALDASCVLTPHEGEFSRLFGAEMAAMPKLERTRKAAALAGCTVLLKGAETVIAAPDGRATINDNAPPWLATAGAGDVLAGMILGLLAQNMPVFEATSAAAWLHGRTAANHGMGLIAEDIVERIPSILRQLSALAGRSAPDAGLGDGFFS